jgi:alkylated DNA nucleotide flippase Atl1
MVAARTPNTHRAPVAKRTATSRTTRPTAPRRKATRVGWEAKLRPELEPRLVEDSRRGGRLLLPTPLLVGEVVASIPRGKVMTLGQLRAELAARFGADSTCPLMTGIFVAILAGVVVEDLGRRHEPRWPIWRVVRDNGTLHAKWPLDPLYRATLLRQEGVRLTRSNGHWAVIDTHHC